MITNCLLNRIAALKKRGGFTLVELLVVIAVIAILAGVALGPITNGIKQAKHNASMQQARQIGQVAFAYASDNTQNGNTYPAGTDAPTVANMLINSNYVTDPSLFCVSGAAGGQIAASGGSSITTTNITYVFTCRTTNSLGGVTSAASDLLPLIFFSGVTATVNTAGSTATVSTGAPFGTDGSAVFYKGNNAAYLKAISASIPNFVSPNYNDTTSTTYQIAQ